MGIVEAFRICDFTWLGIVISHTSLRRSICVSSVVPSLGSLARARNSAHDDEGSCVLSGTLTLCSMCCALIDGGMEKRCSSISFRSSYGISSSCFDIHSPVLENISSGRASSNRSALRLFGVLRRRKLTSALLNQEIGFVELKGANLNGVTTAAKETSSVV